MTLESFMGIWKSLKMPVGFYSEAPELNKETSKYHGYIRTIKDGAVYEAKYQIDVEHLSDITEDGLRTVLQQMIHYLQLHLPLKPEGMTIH